MARSRSSTARSPHGEAWQLAGSGIDTPRLRSASLHIRWIVIAVLKTRRSRCIGLTCARARAAHSADG
eukprot:3191613-Prymnesium_polylepis.1